MINPTDSQMEYERDEFLSILQDLIAELRKQHKRCCPPRDKRKDHECLGCRENWPCSHTRTLDSAEAQLKQLG